MKLEINGRTVEVDDSFARLSPEEQNRTVNEIAASMGLTASEPAQSPPASALGIAAPAVTAAGFAQPTGLRELGQTVGQATQPLRQAVTSIPATYAASPGKAVVDVGAAALGLPPPYASIQAGRGAMDVFRAAGQSMTNLNQALSSLPAGTENQAAKFVNELRPQDVQSLMAKINSEGLEKALKTAVVPNYVSDQARAGLAATQAAFPSGMQKLGQIAGPLMRGAARVAGPAGLAYDVYEAYPYFRQAEIGQNRQTGDTQNLIQRARQAPLSAPTPAPLTPQEAQNLVSSGDQRLMQIYRDDQELSHLIRRRAAEQVLGPIAPGSF